MFPATGQDKESQPSTSSSIELSQPCRQFELAEILLATDNFDDSLVIGRGGFGKVYKGNIINGLTVSVAAIKRLDPMSSQGASEFWAEVDMLSNFNHPHLVSLLGYCNHENEMILVYEYLPNGTLADHLHKLAKISDFGLSKISPTNQPITYVNTRVKGTFGYLDPDYSFTGRLTRKSDVYAFGVVLLEILCRKPALDFSLDEEQQNLARWAQESIKEGNLKHIIDSGIKDQISPKSMKEFVRIAVGCLHSKQKQRPTMAEVVFGLESVLTLQWKVNSPLKPSHRTILGRMVDKFPFTSNIESSGKTIFGQTVVSLPSNPDNYGISTLTERSQSCPKFEFLEILLATNNFDESLVIGHDAFGKVYKGTVNNGSSFAVAAIKRLDLKFPYAARDFCVEIEILSELHHDHLVSLFGYCNFENEKILIYEYMPNGSLKDHLHELGTPLSWLQRLKICIGAARGLDYLHTGMGTECVIHCNVRTSIILIQESWAAKISDFGLSKRTPTNQPSTNATYGGSCIAGTLGYLDPEYLRTGRLSRMSDVYSFGVVLLEVLCRKSAMDRSLLEEGWILVEWAHNFIEEDDLNHIIDLGIRDQISPNCLKKFVQIVEGCLHDNQEQRPSMAEVVVNLESVPTIQEKTNSLVQLHEEQ